MARKKQDLSLEERLEQALVPESEQPYKVPENWVWVRLGSICNNVQYGYTAKSSAEITGPKLLRITDIQDDFVDWGNVPYCEISQGDYEKFLIHLNDIVVARTGATTGKSYLITENVESVFASYLIRVNLKNEFNYEYLYNFMHSDIYWNQITELSQGIAQPGVNATKLQTILYPLPPLAEQQRIVDRIESLFEKLEQAKGLIQDALDSFEDRKAAILHQAFTGELTKKWREEHGVGMDSWEEKSINECITSLNQGWSPKCESFPSDGIDKWGVIKTTAIQHMEFIETENKQLPDNIEPKIQHEIIEEDILITRAGPRVRVGVCCMVKNIRPKLLLCDKAYRLRTKINIVLPEYLVMQLNTVQKLNEINKMKTGISDSGVNLTQKGFLIIKIMVPSISEQIEIVKILENSFNKEQFAKDLYDLVDKIDLMKKSILARAFRGELGTNDPAEESALEVLREVLTH